MNATIKFKGTVIELLEFLNTHNGFQAYEIAAAISIPSPKISPEELAKQCVRKNGMLKIPAIKDYRTEAKALGYNWELRVAKDMIEAAAATLGVDYAGAYQP